MSLGNGLGLHEDLDSRMHEYVENIRYLTSEISQKNREIRSAEETLEDLRSNGLATPELEDSFSKSAQDYLKEKAELEQKREAIHEAATKELEEAKEQYGNALNKVNSLSGSQAKEFLISIRDSVSELGDWAQELQDAMEEQPSSPVLKKTKHL